MHASSLRRLMATGSAVCVAAALGLHAQGPAAPQDPADRLSGPWRLNHETSSTPPEPATMLPAAGGGSSSGDDRPSGGGRRGGYGGRGGGGSTRANAGPTADEIAAMRFVFRELTDPPDGLTIVASTGVVELTGSDGTIRKFNTNGDAQTVEMDNQQVRVTTHWDRNVLRQEFDLYTLKMARTLQTTDDNTQLIINVTKAGTVSAADLNARAAGAATASEGQSAAPPPGFRYVFDKL